MRTGRLVVLGLTLAAGCGSAGAPAAQPPTSTTTTTVTSRTTTTSTSTTTSTTVTTPPAAPAPPPANDPVPADPADPRIHPVTASELGASWHEGCPVGPDRLRRITVTHVGFDGADHTGDLVVHADWAEALLGVFDQIHAAGFPIAKIVPIDAYGGSDDASMADDNTSAFNCRPVTDGTSWSRHSYGRAIDINPIENPYVRCDGTFEPPAGEPYTHDRTGRTGEILDGDAVVQAFAAIGWQWGGHWRCPTDYQHFDYR